LVFSFLGFLPKNFPLPEVMGSHTVTFFAKDYPTLVVIAKKHRTSVPCGYDYPITNTSSYIKELSIYLIANNSILIK